MKLLFISLGCDKNRVDSEVMLGLINQKGYLITDDETEADIIVINTCCFINDAKEESINTILEMAEYKKTGQAKALIVTGCLAQRYQEEIIKEIEEVDAVVGTGATASIVDAIEDALNGMPQNKLEGIDKKLSSAGRRILSTGGHYAHLKIAEGCDKHCTYCIIPRIRGTYRSVPMEDLISEAGSLVDMGVTELILVAQETTLYGTDLYGEKKLPELLRKLCRIEGLKWIRILYCYPEEITPEMIQVIKEEDKICKYLDIPIQHASDHILMQMGRKTNQKSIRNVIALLRKEIPDICLRTTLISGFPGETKEDHEMMLDFVDEMQFDRLGVFTYSPEEDTPAAEREDQIPEDIKEMRQAQIMELQQEIAFEKAENMVGKEVYAMIEGKISEEDTYVARTYKDAPDVDGYLFVHSEGNFMSGDFIKVNITAAHEYDLIGEEIE